MTARMTPVGGGSGTRPYGGGGPGTSPEARPSGVLPESEYCPPGAEPLGGAPETKDDANER